MKLKYKNLLTIFFLILFILIFQSQIIKTIAQDSITNEQIQEVLTLLTERLAPDLRVNYLSINVKVIDNKIVLNGKVMSDNDKVIAHAAFIKLGEVQNNLDVFPFDDIGLENSYGIVKTPILNIRSIPKHSGELISQALMGETFLILEMEDKWLKVQMQNDSYIGWVEKSGILMLDYDKVNNWRNSNKITINSYFTFVYEEPNLNSNIISKIYYATKLPVLEQVYKFYKVLLPNQKVGYIKEDNISLLSKELTLSIIKQNVVNDAKKFLYTPYLWGGTSSLMTDCSGFVQTLYKFYDYYLPRDADLQQKYTKHINNIENLEAGDLVFFPGHVGLYIGNKKFIHSSASLGGVSISSFDPNDKDYFEWCAQNFKGGGRIVK